MQTSANVIAGYDAKASDFNKVVADLAEIYAGGPGIPVGGVIAWWSDNTVPLNFKVCDGTAVADAQSPLNGLTIPDMTDRFIRGVASANIRTSPVSGGEDDVTLTASQMPVHSHSVNQSPHGHGVNDPGHTHSQRGRNNVNGDGAGSEWTDEFDTRGGINAALTGISIQSSNANISLGNAGSGASHNNIPAYRGFVYVMRIK